MSVPDDGLPEPPGIRRDLAFGAGQLVGVPLLAALPVLAVFGVFGVAGGESVAAAAGMELRVSYPERFRFKMSHPFRIGVRNTGREVLERVKVLVDRRYLAAFSEVQFVPQPEEVTARNYVFELHDIPPGAQVNVTGSVQAEEHGLHRGWVEALAGAGAPLETRFATLAFP